MHQNKITDTLKRIYHLRYNQYKLFPGNADPDKVLYIIRFYPREGLMSMLYHATRHVEYAETKGWTPYIDTQHFRNMYQVRGTNSWECFFSQPKISTDVLYKNRYVICDPGEPGGGGTDNSNLIYGRYWAESFDNYERKNQVFHRCFDINPGILAKVDHYTKMLNLQNCIGVYCRGTDYVSLKPKGHPVQPSVDEVISEVEYFLDKQPSRLFLVTEDSSIKKRFVEYFGTLVQTIDEDYIFDHYKPGSMLADGISSNNKIEIASIYLVKMLCLSQCGRLVASKTNGSLMSLVFNGGRYEEVYVFEKGYYCIAGVD